MDKKIKEEIAVIETEVSTITKNNITVNSKPSLDNANRNIDKINKIQKEIKEKKERITKPLNEALKNVRELFRPIEDDLDNYKAELKRGISIYLDKLEEQKKEREYEALKELENGGELNKVTKKLENTNEAISQVRTRTGKRLKIDISKLSKEFMIPD